MDIISGDELKGKTVTVKPMGHFYEKKSGGDYFSLTYKNRIEDHFAGKSVKIMSYNWQDNTYTIINEMNVVTALDREDFELE